VILLRVTDFTSKRVSERIPFGSRERDAFNALKQSLWAAASQSLAIIDPQLTFSVFTDACDYAVGAILTQTTSEGLNRPVAFASVKLTPVQQRWATIEKEAYAALWALQKFKHWVYGKPITLYSDHNPLVYLTENATHSAKLMRWALAL
jgi:hypothetical protein